MRTPTLIIINAICAALISLPVYADEYVDLPDGVHQLENSSTIQNAPDGFESLTRILTFVAAEPGCARQSVIQPSSYSRIKPGSKGPGPHRGVPGNPAGLVCVKDKRAWFIPGSHTGSNGVYSITRDGVLREVITPNFTPAVPVAPRCGLPSHQIYYHKRELEMRFRISGEPTSVTLKRTQAYLWGGLPVGPPAGGVFQTASYFHDGLRSYSEGYSPFLLPACFTGIYLEAPGVVSANSVAAGVDRTIVVVTTTAAQAPILSAALIHGEVSGTVSLGIATTTQKNGYWEHRFPLVPPTAVTSAIPATYRLTASTLPIATEISIYARPLVMVHGLWGSGASFSAFSDYVKTEYPSAVTVSVNYSEIADQSFTDLRIRTRIQDAIHHALLSAKKNGVIVDKVDIVGHSMGGLAIAATLQNQPQLPVGRFITIGTPKTGSPLATWLRDNAGSTICAPSTGQSGLDAVIGLFCSTGTTVGDLMERMSMPIGPAIHELVPGGAALKSVSAMLQDSVSVSSVGGDNTLEKLFPSISRYANAPATIDGLLGAQNDTVVSLSSQTAFGQQSLPTLLNLVHSPTIDEVLDGESQLGSEKTYRQVLGYLGRNFEENVIFRNVGPSSSDLAINELSDLSLTGWTKLTAGNSTVTPSIGIAFSSLDIQVIPPVGCTITKAFAYDFRGVASMSEPPIRLSILPAAAGNQQIAVLGLCANNRYFSLSHIITRIMPSTSSIRVEPSVLGFDLGSAAFFRIYVNTGGNNFDITDDASTWVANPAVADIPYPGAVKAIGLGASSLNIDYNGIVGSAPIIVIAPADDRIFASGFE